MQTSALIANTIWAGSNFSAYWRFRQALRNPEQTQDRKLRSLLKANADTAFGRAHNLGAIDSYEEFTRRVPLSDYSPFEPWVARIRQGESKVLTREPVTYLVPTSGSTGARKLIPFTAGLQREFHNAIGPWLVDLARQAPGILGGPAYWSVTPVLRAQQAEESAIPIGFDTDASYLGAGCRRLVEKIMAVPPAVQQASSLEIFRRETLFHLLRCRELRLISVWHPSFLALLLDTLPTVWDGLIKDIAAGVPGLAAPNPRRARELLRANPRQPSALWPELRLISCWSGGAAAKSAAGLKQLFPNAMVQPKGLIATEAFVTLPFENAHPLAIRSHFFEFIDASGGVVGLGSLRDGAEYEIVVTTSGGLWRCRLNDRVRVSGWVEQTPSLTFLGRAGDFSDRRGEKLAEPFVAQVLDEIIGAEAGFMLLAPDEDPSGCCYTLYIEGVVQPHWAKVIDQALRRNPHYAYARDLLQLLPPRVFRIASGGFEAYASRKAAQGARLGDIKPAILSSGSGWSKAFVGGYQT